MTEEADKGPEKNPTETDDTVDPLEQTEIPHPTIDPRVVTPETPESNKDASEPQSVPVLESIDPQDSSNWWTQQPSNFRFVAVEFAEPISDPGSNASPINDPVPSSPGVSPPLAAPVQEPQRIAGPPPLQVVHVRPVELSTSEVLENRARLEKEAPRLVDGLRLLLQTSGLVGCAFDGYRGTRATRVVFAEKSSRNVWFVGDVHGDLVALEAALKHIQANGPDDPIVFLGDLIDDGPDGYAVILRVVELLLQDRNRIALLPGNHDVALRQRTNGFYSMVEPCEFADWLNDNRDNEAAQSLGRELIRFVEMCPRAICFHDGLLAAHAGFPHTDLQPTLLEKKDLNREECLNDFVWLRAHDRARRKDPNRTTHGCSFGSQDFEAFRACMGKLGSPVNYLIRGHDHIENRYKFYKAYNNRLLTINTLSHRLEREFAFELPEYTRLPCIARGVKGCLPEVHRLEISPEVIRSIYPEPVESSS